MICFIFGKRVNLYNYSLEKSEKLLRYSLEKGVNLSRYSLEKSANFAAKKIDGYLFLYYYLVGDENYEKKNISKIA